MNERVEDHPISNPFPPNVSARVVNIKIFLSFFMTSFICLSVCMNPNWGHPRFQFRPARQKNAGIDIFSLLSLPLSVNSPPTPTVAFVVQRGTMDKLFIRGKEQTKISARGTTQTKAVMGNGFINIPQPQYSSALCRSGSEPLDFICLAYVG